MRVLSRVVVLSMTTVLAVPSLMAAQSCDDALRACLSGTVLLQPAESWDFAGCNYDYVACLRDSITAY
jgi:hypothetical protein